jgi:hypothetical protein
MRKVDIGGKTFELMNSDEATYGAQKELERVQFAASLAMLSDKDVAELATKTKKSNKEVDEGEFMKRVMSGQIKEALLDANEKAITPEEEAIILSVGITREAILKLPGKTVEKLGKEALKELGTVEDFSKASSSPMK